MTNDGPNQRKVKYEIRRLIDVIFAVVIAQSLLEYRTLLMPPNVAELSFWALIGVYTSAVLSWYSYNYALEENPYILQSTFGKIRFGTDMGIVLLYSYLFLTIGWIRNGLYFVPENIVIQGVNATAAFVIGYSVLFTFYIMDDVFVQLEQGVVGVGSILRDLKIWKSGDLAIEHRNKSGTILGAYTFITVSYILLSNNSRTISQFDRFISTIVIIIAIAMMLFWRFWVDADDL